MTPLEVCAITRLREWQHNRRALHRGIGAYRRSGWVERRTTMNDARNVRNIDFERAMEKLDPAHQQLLLMVYGEGRRYAEIAAIIGSNVSTVRYQTARALERLTAILDKFDLI